MEKQPIDDLFARKLRNADITPEADVFSRLQNRMNTTPMPVVEPKRRLTGWWYGAVAASVLVFIAWLSWPKQNKPTVVVSRELAGSDHAQSAKQQVMPIELKAVEQRAIASTMGRVTVKQARSIATGCQSREINDRLAQSRQPTTLDEPIERLVNQANVPVPNNVPAIEPNSEPLLAKTETITPVSTDKGKPIAGRTVVMTITEPEPVRLVMAQPTKPEITTNTAGLSQLFEKVKQIKSGEVFARATPTPRSTETRTGLGRLVNGVRESLRNE